MFLPKIKQQKIVENRPDSDSLGFCVMHDLATSKSSLICSDQRLFGRESTAGLSCRGTRVSAFLVFRLVGGACRRSAKRTLEG